MCLIKKVFHITFLISTLSTVVKIVIIHKQFIKQISDIALSVVIFFPFFFSRFVQVMHTNMGVCYLTFYFLVQLLRSDAYALSHQKKIQNTLISLLRCQNSIKFFVNLVMVDSFLYILPNNSIRVILFTRFTRH